MVKRFPAIHGPAPWTDEDRELTFKDVVFHPDRLDKPLHWRKPRRIGVCFCGDLFDKGVRDEWIKTVFSRFSLGRDLDHQFFLLTKQPKRMLECAQAIYGTETPGNTWWGISITDQADADRMIPDLLRMPGKRWISIEPMLGEVDLSAWILESRYCPKCRIRLCEEGVKGHGESIVCRKCGNEVDRSETLDWVVIGCESGPRRRPCELEWVQSVVEQCRAAGTKLYVKQLDIGGKVSHNPEDWPAWARVREMG
jgi:protein gp37